MPIKKENEVDVDKFRQPDTVNTSQRVKPKASPSKKKGDQSVPQSRGSESTKYTPGKASSPNSSPVTEPKDSNVRKRKSKPYVSRVRFTYVSINHQSSLFFQIFFSCNLLVALFFFHIWQHIIIYL